MTLDTILERLLHWCTTSGLKLLFGILTLIIGWKIINKIVKTLSNFLDKKNFDITLHTFLEAFVELVLKIVLVILVMKNVGIDTAGLAALITSAGLAIGLALQGSLSNFAGGVIILMMRPFVVGDYIEAAGYDGTVEKIRIFYTHLATIDNKEVMIPNGILANSSLINYSAKDKRRVDIVLGVGYDSNVLHVKRILGEIISSCEYALKEPEPFINITEHGDNSVNYIIKVWTNTENYWDVYYYIIEQAKIKFDEEKISIPYPQMDVHIKKVD